MSATQPSLHKLNVLLRFLVWAKAAYNAILGKLPNTNNLLLTHPDNTNADIQANSILQQKTKFDLIEQHKKLCTLVSQDVSDTSQNIQTNAKNNPLHKKDGLVNFIELVNKVTNAETTVPIFNAPIHFILIGSSNNPIVKKIPKMEASR